MQAIGLMYQSFSLLCFYPIHLPQHILVYVSIAVLTGGKMILIAMEPLESFQYMFLAPCWPLFYAVR